MIDNYHQDTSRISKSGLDLINQCPKKYWHKYLSGDFKELKRSIPLIEGAALHDYLFRPDVFIQNFVIMPNFKGKGSRTARYEWIENNSSKEYITSTQYDMILGMAKSIREHSKLNQLLKSGSAEETWTWTDEETGAQCKLRSDYRSDMGFLLDLKSTFEAGPMLFPKSVWNFRYHVQEPFYTDGVRANGFYPKGFVFVAIEKTPPYLIKLHVLSDEYVQRGRDEYKRNLATYVQCIESGEWPDYGMDTNEIELPNFLQ